MRLEMLPTVQNYCNLILIVRKDHSQKNTFERKFGSCLYLFALRKENVNPAKLSLNKTMTKHYKILIVIGSSNCTMYMYDVCTQLYTALYTDNLCLVIPVFRIRIRIFLGISIRYLEGLLY